MTSLQFGQVVQQPRVRREANFLRQLLEDETEPRTVIAARIACAALPLRDLVAVNAGQRLVQLRSQLAEANGYVVLGPSPPETCGPQLRPRLCDPSHRASQLTAGLTDHDRASLPPQAAYGRGSAGLASPSRDNAPLSTSALTAAPRWPHRCFSSGAISAKVRPTSGTQNTGS